MVNPTPPKKGFPTGALLAGAVLVALVLALFVLPGLRRSPVSAVASAPVGTSAPKSAAGSKALSAAAGGAGVEQGKPYSKPADVALYLHTFGKLPPNFITKEKARQLGWVQEQGNLWKVTDRMSIGGDVYSNFEGRLPKAKGRTWYECDVNYQGGFRGPERLVYSNDGLIAYTKDHYEHFTWLYK